MPTTSGFFASKALVGLLETGAEFALLTARDSIPDGPSSDVDLVVAGPPHQLLADTLDSWCALDLFPIMFWPYDMSGSASVFLVSSDASEGAQLDLLYDPEGRWSYGVSSRALLARTHEVGELPHVDEVGRLVYLWQKRRRKGQLEDVEGILEQARSLSESEIRSAERSIAGDVGLADAAFRSTSVPRFRNPRRLGDLRRYTSRALNPVGFWVGADSEDLALGLRDRLSRVLVSAECGPIPDNRWGVRAWYARNVWPVVVRPQAYVSWGAVTGGAPMPFVAVGGSLDHGAKEMVAALVERIRHCVS